MYTKKTFWSPHVSPLHLYTLFVLSVILWITADFFRIPGILEHPQFKEGIGPDLLEFAMSGEAGVKMAYRLFFFVDFFWASLLVLALVKYLYGRLWTNNPNPKPKVFRILLGIAVVALGLDFCENGYYLAYTKYPQLLATVKEVAYGLLLLGLMLTFLFYAFNKYFKTATTFLKAASYSLLILMLLGSFLPRAPQVNSIVVNLYENPWQLGILFLVAPTFAVVLAHYPSYFNIDERRRNWFMGDWRFALIGIIFYKYKKGPNQKRKGKREDKLNFLYRTLGILFYVALFYMLGYTSEVNFDWTIQVSKLAIILLVIGIVLLYKLKLRKDRWFAEVSGYLNLRFPGFYDGDNAIDTQKDPTEMPNVPRDDCRADNEMVDGDTMASLLGIRKQVLRFTAIFALTVLLHLILLLVLFWCADCRYTEVTVALSLGCIALQMVSYIYYRTFRSVLRFVYYKDTHAINNSFYLMKEVLLIDEESGAEVPESNLSVACKKEHIRTFFEDVDFKMDAYYATYLPILGRAYSRFLRFVSFGALSNNVTFLQATSVLGMANALFFLAINRFSGLALQVNPILVILSASFFYYGLLVVLTKNFIYYTYSGEARATSKRLRFNFILLVGIVAMVVLNRLKQEFPNNLFTLPLVERVIDRELTLDSVVTQLSKGNERYYIGCYGGGMKSNAWTMIVLKALYDQDNTIFKKTVGISGASGGTIGLANMAAMINANPAQPKKWDTLIRRISTENILSLDLTHILGRDTFNHLFVPWANFRGEDRSSRAMERYAILTNNSTEIGQNTPYREFWKKLYENNDMRFPILIANSTNTTGNGGMAVSVGVRDERAQKILYHDSDDVLEVSQTEYDDLGRVETYHSRTLDFFDAVSTSNRFPLISPAAKIETKGHFNDGGIYENSGLLSVWKLYQAVEYLEAKAGTRNPDQQNVFISIVNDKNQYIKAYLKEQGQLRSSKVNESTEFSAILNAVAATEMVPIYIKSELGLLAAQDSSRVAFHTIYLPHRFTVMDVKQLYGEELDWGTGQDLDETHIQLYQAVQRNNTEIRALLDPKCPLFPMPVVEPPMSRVMAEQAYDFMDAMLVHPMTVEVMERIASEGQ